MNDTAMLRQRAQHIHDDPEDRSGADYDLRWCAGEIDRLRDLLTCVMNAVQAVEGGHLPEKDDGWEPLDWVGQVWKERGAKLACDVIRAAMQPVKPGEEPREAHESGDIMPRVGEEPREAYESGDIMPRVGGATTAFRCDCGGNVFKFIRRDKTRVRCNSCQVVYESVPADPNLAIADKDP